MKSDLDALMEAAALDAVLVTGAAALNPSMHYFTGRAHLTSAELLKKRGEPPVLFCRSMEREEAARTGLRTQLLDDYDPVALLKEAHGDAALATARLYRRMFEDHGVHGRVARCGRTELGLGLATTRQLAQEYPSVELVGAVGNLDVVGLARVTKDADEVERIRRMGKVTTSVVADTAGFLCAHRAKEGVLVNQQGEVLTIGEVKRRINLWLAMRGADNPEGTVFAIGRDAGVPHSAGDDAQPVEVGKAIVFDIFPCEVGGGYFYDFTRTWCVGYAPDEVASAFEQVRSVQQQMIASLRGGTLFREYQLRTCQAFESMGHPTVQSTPGTKEGYVHSLGHGVGLAVQEKPASGYVDTNADTLLPGSVVTVEPGLYYPDRGFGVRIEDTVWIRPDGKAEVLADYPRDLVLKVAGV